ncbi:unnamed protein product [Tetraodon nigroviridis]|uniref:(spotted green pufferfish) hypothetical protein n=1 Tax=Tetraodon nigroviridis TaxID=99883 RepID=Q4RTD9_TETNG|nr:unnamed protein product [Tetraodon nigroviridis]
MAAEDHAWKFFCLFDGSFTNLCKLTAQMERRRLGASVTEVYHMELTMCLGKGDG